MPNPAARFPAAVERAQALWIWLDARVQDFPAASRHLLGARLVDCAIELLDALLAAAYAPRGSPELLEATARAAQRTALLRHLLRGARERRYLAASHHDYAIEKLAELGRMIGGWRRHAQAHGGPRS